MDNPLRTLLSLLQHSKQIQQASPPHQRPLKTPEEWRIYWQARGFPWRTEPEIDVKRQEALSRHRAIIPDIEKGIYPFKGMHLKRADVEWLLATHENGKGPVDWSDESQRKRQGLDLRGADLCGTDLSQLPLAKLYAGPPFDEWPPTSTEQHELAATLMRETNLRRTHLEGAELSRVHLGKASLRRAYLQEADRRSLKALLHFMGESSWNCLPQIHRKFG